MKEDRHAELFDASVKRFETLGIDPGVPADAAGNIHTHQPEFGDRVVKNVDGDLRIRQRYCGAGPHSAGILTLRLRHLPVPHECGVTPLLRRQIGKIDREGTERANHADVMTQAIHMFELPVEIKPFRPGIDRRTALMSEIVVSAAAVAFRARISAAFAKLFENLAGPPVKMGVDDTHAVYLALPLYPWAIIWIVKISSNR